jgi:3-oxo-5-alpha-steroid 4-dehydrogenase 1
MLQIETFRFIVYTWIALAVFLFPLLLKVTVPYGRHSRSTWGPMIDNKLGWLFMEITSLWVFIIFFLSGDTGKSAVTWIFFALWVIHYVNRSLVFPFRTRTRGKKMPLIIMVSAIFFNLMNGFINGYWFGYVGPGYQLSWLKDPRFIGGMIIFISGFTLNQWADRKLLNLRREPGNGYFIPRGGLFNYVSCPNFLGEIIEWTGFAIMAWNPATLSFAIWTIVNLLPRALDHHKWYNGYFKEYPKNRKSIIPYLL